MPLFQIRLANALKDNIINQYMHDKLLQACKNGISEQIFDTLINDAKLASKVGVKNDKDYGVYFFVNKFADKILKDTFDKTVGKNDKLDILKFAINKTYNDLLDVTLMLHKWSHEDMIKKAHPNITGIIGHSQKQDVDKWVNTLKEIYLDAFDRDISEEQAVNDRLRDWDIDEKNNFLNWVRYYESGTARKYNVKNAKLIKTALMPPSNSILEQWVRPESRADLATQAPQSAVKSVAPQKTQREMDMERAKEFKAKMKSRLYAVRRLLDKYQGVMPKSNVDAVLRELFNLENSVNKLEVYASMQNVTIRSAGKLEKFGFTTGADFLKMAAEPDQKEILESLPTATTDSPETARKDVNVSLTTIIDRLEGISKRLKSRTTIRELASVDILLNEMGLASYFPEITDAQAKLIESYGYASNRIEGVIAKLRGSGTAQPEPAPTVAPQLPPLAQPTIAPKKEKLNKEEIMSAPPAQIQTKLPTPTK